jgi:hypothetical protein
MLARFFIDDVWCGVLSLDAIGGARCRAVACGDLAG